MPTEQNIPHDKQNGKPSSKQTDLCSHEATAGEKLMKIQRLHAPAMVINSL